MIKKPIQQHLNSDRSCGCGIVYEESAQRKVRIESIVSAIEGEDKEALKALFSTNVLEEADDLDAGIDAVFEFIKGDILFWDAGALHGSRSYEEGKKSFMLRYQFELVTDEDSYKFSLIDYPVDTIESDNKGLYALYIQKSSGAVALPWSDPKAGITVLE